MADFTVRLDVEDRSGILSSAVTRLRRFGLLMERHRLDARDNARQLVLEASGALADPEGLREKLLAIRGVIRIAEIADHDALDEPSPGADPAPATPPQPPSAEPHVPSEGSPAVAHDEPPDD